MQVQHSTTAQQAKMAELKRVLVTGGNGLVGRALQEEARKDAKSDEEWIFISSKDGDLRYFDKATALQDQPITEYIFSTLQ